MSSRVPICPHRWLQIYGLFGTPASPGHWDHLIEPGARGPGHRVLTADAQRMLLQLQPLPRWLQQHVSIRSIQGGPQISVRSWSSMNPSYTHILWGLGDVEEMVEAMFPAFTPAFRHLGGGGGSGFGGLVGGT